MGCDSSKVHNGASEPTKEPQNNSTKQNEPITTATSEKPTETDKTPKLYWLNGYPCTGKTFLADYLATQGWHMVDGDYKNYSGDPTDADTWGAFYQALVEYWTKSRAELPPEALWKPHHEDLVRMAKEGLSQGKNVVVAFVAYKQYVRDWLREQLPGVKFVNIDVNVDTLGQRFYQRGLKAVEQMGLTMEQYWDSEENAPYKTVYGDYTRETYDKFVRESYFVGFEPFSPTEQDCFTIDNNDFTDNKSIRHLNNLVGITGEPQVDVAAIEAVQMGRYAKMAEVMGGATEGGEEAAT